MRTKIKTWQIIDNKLECIDTSLQSTGRTEPYDLQPWIESNPEILSDNILIIGSEVATESGPGSCKMDLLGINSSGDTIIVELKRDKMYRKVLAQAIDYASAVAGWSLEELDDFCNARLGKTLEEAFNGKFPDVDFKSINFNEEQRILLVGFSIEPSLERMIEWLSETYSVSINVIILNYIETKGGEKLLSRTSMISEEGENKATRKGRELRKHRLAFWKNFVNYCRENGRGDDIASREPSSNNWYDLKKDKGYHIFFQILMGNILRIGLYVYRPELFERLEAQKKEIENAYGSPLDWYTSRETNTAKRILHSIEVDIYNPELYHQHFNWLISQVDKLKAALEKVDINAN